MTDHEDEIEDNLDNPLVAVAARANQLAEQISLLRGRATDRAFADILRHFKMSCTGSPWMSITPCQRSVTTTAI